MELNQRYALGVSGAAAFARGFAADERDVRPRALGIATHAKAANAWLIPVGARATCLAPP